MMDCGPGSLLRLHQAGVSLQDLKMILISHFHLDHVSDLLPVLHSRWLQNGRKTAATRIIGPYGLKRRFRGYMRSAKWVRELDLELMEMGNDRLSFDGLSIDTGLTGHTQESICFRLIDRDGRVLFYSGDADDYQTLVALSSCADLALVECSWPSAPAWEGHLTPEMAGRLAASGQVRQLLLTHFYQPVQREDMMKEVAAVYEGPIELAEDLKKYAIVK